VHPGQPAALCVVTAAFANWTFRAYQRSLKRFARVRAARQAGATATGSTTQIVWPAVTCWPGETARAATVPLL